MGTTVEKADYAFETKDLLKTEINKINNVLDDNSTFRSYPQELFNGYLDILNNGTDTLWSNLEKVSQTGTEVALEGVETAPMKMVLNGNTSQDGEPTPDTPIPVQVVKGENVVSVQGKQLFDYKDFSITYRGVTLKNENNLFSISGTAQSGYYPQITITRDQILTRNYWSNSPTMNPDIDLTKDLISFKDLTKEHVISLKNFEFEERAFSFIRVYYGEENFNSVTLNANNLFGVIPAGENIKGIGFALSEKGTYSSIFNFQLEKGSTPTPYVPYSKTDYPINLGDIELCEINTYKDYFHKDSGKWYVHKEIGKKIFDGTEFWRTVPTNTTDVYRMLTTSLKGSILAPATSSTQFLAFCSRFKPIIADDTYKKNEGISCARDENVHIYMEDYNTSTSATDFKTWLSTHNVTLYYVLATPTEEEITNSTLIEQLEAIYKAKSVKDKTYITQTNDELPFILDVEAIKEYEVV